MFEKVKPVPHAQSAPIEGRFADRIAGQFGGGDTLDGGLLVGSIDTAPEIPASGGGAGGGGALRLIEWNELTARLNAARDLRLVLRRDSRGNIEAAGGSFADAAARYFRTREEEERDVNPVALEHCKGSPHITREQQGLEPPQAPPKPRNRDNEVTGDGRED
jgi:hypothetical protein